MHCVADFCIIPVGVSASVTQYIAEAQRVLEKTGLKYELHGYGTGIEGDWDDVMTAIKQVHEALHKMGVPRCATDIRIGTRTDKASSLEAKVQSVRRMLGEDSASAN